MLLVGMPDLAAALAAATLEDHGFAVAAVRDPRSALERTHGDGVELCLVDLDRLGLDAIALSVSLATGSDPPRIVGVGCNAHGAPVDGLLSRPYAPPELLDAVRVALRRTVLETA